MCLDCQESSTLIPFSMVLLGVVDGFRYKEAEDKQHEAEGTGHPGMHGSPCSCHFSIALCLFIFLCSQLLCWSHHKISALNTLYCRWGAAKTSALMWHSFAYCWPWHFGSMTSSKSSSGQQVVLAKSSLASGCGLSENIFMLQPPTFLTCCFRRDMSS